MDDFGSRQVSWWEVHLFVEPMLLTAGDYPAAGTPAWCNLQYDDPRKLAAVLDAGRQWALRCDTLQEELAQAATEIAAQENWHIQAQRVLNQHRRIARRVA